MINNNIQIMTKKNLAFLMSFWEWKENAICVIYT